MLRRSDEPKVFFPWERRHGVRSLFMRARARQALLIVCGIAVFALMRARENRAAEVRSTRTTIGSTIDAVAAWRADHDRVCPDSLATLVASGYLSDLPRDAWGRPLRMTCPGRHDRYEFDIVSDGPTGEGGLDRVE